MNTYTATVTELPDAQISIEGEISWEVLAQYEKKAFNHMAEHLDIAGFRKGHIPTEVAKTHIPEPLLLNEMAEKAVQEIYPTIIKEKNLDVIGRPNLFRAIGLI